MHLTKFAHSCVRIDGPGGALVIDPGVFSDSADALDGAAAVLITHEHADHLDVPAVLEAARSNRELRIWVPHSVAPQLGELGDRVTIVAPGEHFDAVGLPVRTVGGQHALIHPTIPMVANVGYVIGAVGAALYHPGDALIVPTEAVETLLVPIGAPWSKIGEVIDFVIAVRARAAHQIHEAGLSVTGLGMVEGHVQRIGAGYGVEFAHLDTGASTDIGA